MFACLLFSAGECAICGHHSQEPLPIKEEKSEPATACKEPVSAPPCAVARPLVDDGPILRLESGELTIEDAVYFSLRYGSLKDMKAKLAGRVNDYLWAELEVVFTLCAVYGHHVDTIIHYFKEYMARRAKRDNSPIAQAVVEAEVEEIPDSPEKPAPVPGASTQNRAGNPCPRACLPSPRA